jgi:hypothetical protein
MDNILWFVLFSKIKAFFELHTFIKIKIFLHLHFHYTVQHSTSCWIITTTEKFRQCHTEFLRYPCYDAIYESYQYFFFLSLSMSEQSAHESIIGSFCEDPLGGSFAYLWPYCAHSASIHL